MVVKTVDLASLVPYARNPRKRPASAVAAVAESLKKFGWQQPIVARLEKRDRGWAHPACGRALSSGWTIGAGEVVISDDQAAAYRLVDNRSGEFTAWDDDLLRAELDALPSLDGLDLEVFDFDTLLPSRGGLTDPDDVPDPPENAISKRGDVWTLGGHRLMCGDATDPDDVSHLLAGAKPELLITDPPYGVKYDPTWRYRAGVSTKDGAFGSSDNDDESDWQAAYALFPGTVAYIWMGSLGLPIAARGLEASGFQLRSLIIWDKGHIVIGRGHYHWRHESCWYAVRKGATARWVGERNASTVWEIDNPRKSETGHSAQKPVACMQRAIANHEGDVYDPFMGSGTTLIGGESEGRHVYGLEINPLYVDVSVARWEAFTGQKAVKGGP